MSTRTTETFDCIAFKRSAQARLHHETVGMSRAEELRYFGRQAESGPLGEWWKRVRMGSGVPEAAAAGLEDSAVAKFRAEDPETPAGGI